MIMKLIRGLVLALLGFVAVGIGLLHFWPYSAMNNDVDAGLAYAAKLSCSGVYVGGRALDEVITHDLLPINPVFEKLSITQNKAQSSVTASLLGIRSRTALYRPALGCTLLSGDVTAKDLLEQAKGISPITTTATTTTAPWPLGDTVAIAKAAYSNALQAAIAPEFTNNLEGQIDTRAVLVIHKGKIVAEHYANGFDANSRFLGWSMSKSVTSALVGVLVDQGKLKLDAPAPVPEWAKDAQKSQITLADLLHMQSGQHFNEEYGVDSDVVRLLFAEADMGGYTASKQMDHAPGTVFNYNTGTATLLSKIVQQSVGGTLQSEYDFAQKSLFEPAGMRSAVFEADASGVLSGGSYVYATGRDWARFGLLYLNDGEINGTRILSKDWVTFTRAENAKGSEYGAHFWLNSGFETGKDHYAYPDLPRDMYYAAGHNGQFIAIFPSDDLVIVRLGWTPEKKSSNTNRLFTAIYKAVKSKP